MREIIVHPGAQKRMKAERFIRQKNQSRLQSEQWFRNNSAWFKIAVSNPSNFNSANSELATLLENRKGLAPLIKGCLQVHYGVGVGETEQQLVLWELEGSKSANIMAIDSERAFLSIFLENIRQRRIEYPDCRISFQGHNALFQEFDPKSIGYSGRACHICLGGTVGNFYPQEEIWETFGRNCKKGDLLLLGFQLDTYFQQTFEKYAGHPLYPAFVLNGFGRRDLSKAVWRKDESSGYITMHFGGIEVFRTRKYHLGQPEEDLKKHGFGAIGEFFDGIENYCVAVFEKVG